MLPVAHTPGVVGETARLQAARSRFLRRLAVRRWVLHAVIAAPLVLCLPVMTAPFDRSGGGHGSIWGPGGTALILAFSFVLLVIVCLYVGLQLTWSADSYAPRRGRDPVLPIDWSEPQWRSVAQALADAGYDHSTVKAVSVFSQAGNIRITHLPHFNFTRGRLRWAEIGLAQSLTSGDWKWRVLATAAPIVVALSVTPGVTSVSFWLIVVGGLFLDQVFWHVLIPISAAKRVNRKVRRPGDGQDIKQESDPRHIPAGRAVRWWLITLEAVCVAVAVYFEPGHIWFWYLATLPPPFLFYAVNQVRVNLLRSDSVIEVPVAWRSALRRSPLLARVAFAHEMAHASHGDTAARRFLRQAVPWMAGLAWWDVLNLIAGFLPSVERRAPVHGRDGLVLILAGSAAVLLVVGLSTTAGIMRARRLLYAIHELRADAEACPDEAAMRHMHAIVARAQQAARSRTQAMRICALTRSWTDPLAGAFWRTLCIMVFGFCVPVGAAVVGLWAAAFPAPPAT